MFLLVALNNKECQRGDVLKAQKYMNLFISCYCLTRVNENVAVRVMMIYIEITLYLFVGLPFMWFLKVNLLKHKRWEKNVQIFSFLSIRIPVCHASLSCKNIHCFSRERFQLQAFAKLGYVHATVSINTQSWLKCTIVNTRHPSELLT